MFCVTSVRTVGVIGFRMWDSAPTVGSLCCLEAVIRTGRVPAADSRRIFGMCSPFRRKLMRVFSWSGSNKGRNKGETMDNGIERMSDHIHSVWARWIEYMFSFCTENDNGTLTIPKENVDRWSRQRRATYAELLEAEKESDRIEAREILAIAKEQ